MESLWSKTVELPKFDALKQDVKTDVLIIGGGMTGILTAYMLDKKGVDYCLVEGGRICGGTTANTTAKITAQHGAVFTELIATVGKEKAQMYLEANLQALRFFKEECKNIDCDFEIKDNFVYSVTNKEILEDEMFSLGELGYKAELCSKLPLPFKNVGGVKFTSQAQFNPLKFINEISKNLEIYENTYIKEVKDGVAYTDKYRIKAEKIIVATHFPFINSHGSYFLKLYQHRSYVLGLKNAADLGGMYVDEAQDGFSFRNYGDLLLLGGGSHRTGKEGGGYRVLREFANKYYSDSEELYHFAAQDCMSLDKMSYIGKYSALTSKMYVATGFNKWGMTGSAVAAMILTDMILGKQNIYEEAFSPSRSILKPQLAINGFETVTNILKLKTPRCTHLGCALKWNKYEHSWDCACHGSRFSQSGEVLENPATKNLDIKDSHNI